MEKDEQTRQDKEILTVCNADTLEWDSPYGDKSQLGKKEKGKP